MFVVAVCCHFWKQYQNFDCFTNKDLLCKEFKMCRRSTRKLITTSEIVNPFSLQTWTPWLALVIIWLVLVTMWLVIFHFSHLRTYCFCSSQTKHLPCMKSKATIMRDNVNVCWQNNDAWPGTVNWQLSSSFVIFVSKAIREMFRKCLMLLS